MGLKSIYYRQILISFVYDNKWFLISDDNVKTMITHCTDTNIIKLNYDTIQASKPLLEQVILFTNMTTRQLKTIVLDTLYRFKKIQIIPRNWNCKYCLKCKYCVNCKYCVCCKTCVDCEYNVMCNKCLKIYDCHSLTNKSYMCVINGTMYSLNDLMNYYKHKFMNDNVDNNDFPENELFLKFA